MAAPEMTAEQLANYQRVMLAHGVVACLCWMFFFPMGAILLRALKGPAAIKAHIIAQTIAYILFTAAVGMGIWMAKTIGKVRSPSQ